MKRHSEGPDDESLFHLILGTPDPECEVCRAHGRPDLGGPGIIIEIQRLDDLLGCPCPLCRQARSEPL